MTTITSEKPQVAEIPTGVEIDPVTLDIIEGALKSARYEMDAVLFRSAMSPVIREQHDEFPMITDPRGRMVVGQFGAYINEMMEDWDRGIYPGDVILTSDPFKCSASISHTNDWLVLVPIFYDDELVGWSSQFGHQMDAGGPLPGSLPTGAKTIFEEGIIIPPLKIVERGEVQEDVLRLILNNVRNPEMNRADLFAIVAGCRAGERRVIELCDRFGKETYLAALQALLDRTYNAMKFLISVAIPEEPQTFVDYIDDDGLGNGPYKMQLTIWREGEHAFFDWSGTDPQALGPINFYLSEGMFKMFIGIYLIMVNDPQILFNDGFYPLLHVVMPEGSLLRPRYPAALGCRTHALARQFDVLGGALCKNAPELNTAAGYGTSPYMLYSGWEESGDFFYSMEILYGGIPGRPIGDGMDGHSWWPLFENIPTEYLEAYYPLRIDGYTTVTDSGGPGLHRGGNGVEKRYVYLEPGEVSIHDDRWLTAPVGRPRRAARSRARRSCCAARTGPSRCWPRSATTSSSSQATCSSTARQAEAAGRTGSTDRPSSSPATSRSGSSAASARRRATASSLPTTAPSTRRRRARSASGNAPSAAMHRRSTSGRRSRTSSPTARTRPASTRRRPRHRCAGRRSRTETTRSRGSGPATASETHHEGFHGRAGFGRRPALVVIDVNRGFTDPDSPLVCDLDGVVDAIRLLLDGFPRGRAAGRLHHRCVRRGGQASRGGVHREGSRAARSRSGQPLDGDRPAHRTAGRRARADEALGVGLPRDAAFELPHLARVRLARRHGRLDFRVRPSDGGRRAAARLPRAGPAGCRRRSQPRRPRGESLRHRHEVR